MNTPTSQNETYPPIREPDSLPRCSAHVREMGGEMLTNNNLLILYQRLFGSFEPDAGIAIIDEMRSVIDAPTLKAATAAISHWDDAQWCALKIRRATNRPCECPTCGREWKA